MYLSFNSTLYEILKLMVAPKIMPMCWSTVPVNVTLFTKSIFTDGIKLESWAEITLHFLGGPISNDACLSTTQKRRHRNIEQDRDRHWNDAATSPPAKEAGNPQSRKRQTTGSPWAWERAWLCSHLDFELLTSKTAVIFKPQVLWFVIAGLLRFYQVLQHGLHISHLLFIPELPPATLYPIPLEMD